MALFYKKSQSAVVPRPKDKSLQTPLKSPKRVTLLQFDWQGVPDPRLCSSKAPVTVRIVCTLNDAR